MQKVSKVDISNVFFYSYFLIGLSIKFTVRIVNAVK